MADPHVSKDPDKRPRRPRRCASIEVGDTEKHTFEVYFSAWGLEVYVVDDEEVLRVRNLSPRSTQKFTVGAEEKHEIEVRLDMMPSWRAALRPDDWIAHVYVDGELVVDDLIPDLRKQYKSLQRVSNIALFVALGALVTVCVAAAIICHVINVLEYVD